jgi:peptidoglycan/LPS O-acetylase OafA/YrhL
MAGHLLPLGPKALMLNVAACGMGMALFFILSGFLITRFLDQNADLVAFLVKRTARIIPLAYLYFLILFLFFNHGLGAFLSELSFTLNYRDADIGLGNGHIWSLCVEMQFYLVMGLLYRLAPKPAPLVLLGLCLAVTAMKIAAAAPYSMMTHLRGDEILAGSLLYSSFNGRFGDGRFGDHAKAWRWMDRLAPLTLILFLLSCDPRTGPFQYLRAYLAAALVGGVLATTRPRVTAVLTSRPAAYVASISYALYIIHGGLMSGVFSGGPKLILYGVKRPFTIVASFALAHVSSTWYEPFWRRRANDWLRSSRAKQPQIADATP